MFDTSGCSPAVFCGDASGLQNGAPWPMLWGCPSHAGRTPIHGPTSQTVKQFLGPPNGLVGPTVVSADGTIYSAGFGGVSAFSKDGTLLFTLGVGANPLAQSSPAISADGTVSAVIPQANGDDARLVHFDESGAMLWTQSLEVDSPPTIGPDGTIYVAGDQLLHGFDPTTGAEVLTAALPGLDNRFMSPAITSDGVLVVTSYLGQTTPACWVSAVDAAGTTLFTTPLGPSTGPGCTAPVIASNGDIYVVHPPSLVALRKDGSMRFDIDLSLGQANIPMLAADGTIYVSADDSAGAVLIAVHPDGTVAWKVSGGMDPVALMVTGEGDIWTAISGSKTQGLQAVHPDGSLGLHIPKVFTAGSSYYGIAADGAFVGVNGGNVGSLQLVGP
jgi:hypothetical protein